jgi:hypothetical protein
VPESPASARVTSSDPAPPLLAPPELASEAAVELAPAPETASAPLPLPQRPSPQPPSGSLLDPNGRSVRIRETPEEIAKRQEDLLVSAGFGSGAARDLRQRFEALTLAQQYLRNQARQEEGAAALELGRKLKQEIGEDAYSYMLWSGGSPNRVVVQDVLPGSTASRVALQPGDVVMRYDGERIFEMDELRASVLQPSVQKSADLEILRAGQLLKISVPRGILGISVGGSFDPPRVPDPRMDRPGRRIRSEPIEARP